MKLELYEAGGRNPQEIDASRILIRDDHGNPIVFAVQYSKGGVDCCMVATPDDPVWESLLGTIGVRPSVVRHRIDAGGEPSFNG